MIALFGFSQNDTSAFPKPHSEWYARLMPIGVSTSAGLMADRTTQNIEFGRSFDVIDLGVAYGRLTQRSDTTRFAEIKATMDACQYGIFSNEFTFGAGRIFNSSTPYLFEISTTMMVQVNKFIGAGVVVGDYYTTGVLSSNSNQFFGLFLRYGLLRSTEGVLVRPGHHVHHHK